jgi:hypothetical protein
MTSSHHTDPEQQNGLRSSLAKKNARSSLANIAKEAQISSKTLADIKDSATFRDELRRATQPTIKRRRLAGLAASVARLAVYLDVEPRDALAELGFPMDEPLVSDSLKLATVHAQRRQLVTDRTLAQIKGRTSTGEVHAAIVTWKPFYDDTDVQRCFALRYLTMLLHAVDPGWKITPFWPDSIAKAMKLTLQDQNEYDLVFGLYAVPFRRSIGLSFIPVPGFRVPLGAISSGQARPNWPQIITQSTFEDLRAIVLREEAGHHILAGACGYPRDSLKILEERKPIEIATAFVRIASDEQAYARTVFFLADFFTCQEVFTKIQEWRAGKDLPRDLSSKPIPHVHSLEPTSEWAPSYSVSIGIRSDSRFFGTLLQEATETDLFYNAALRTATLYFDLLRKPVSEGLLVYPEYFHSVGKEASERFRRAYCHVVHDKSHSQAVTLKGKAGDLYRAFCVPPEPKVKHGTKDTRT